MDFIARVNPKYLAAIACFMASNDIRYYLNGILIEPHPKGGVVIVATNGHVVGAMHDAQGFAKEAIIISPDNAILKACRLKAWQKRFVPAAVWISNRCAVVTADITNRQSEEPPELFGSQTITTAPCSPINGKFPNWRKVMDVDETSPEDAAHYPHLAARVLEPFIKAAQILSPKYQAIHMTPSGENTSVRVRIETAGFDPRDNFFGLAMPMRADRPQGIYPEWVGLVPVPESI